MSKNIFLGVTQKDQSTFDIGHESFWCVFKNSNITSGDILILYKTKIGIVQVFEVISNPSKTPEYDCKYRKMITISTKLKAKIEIPITIKMMKEDSILCNSGPIRKNLQNTFFSFEGREGEALITLITKYNPNIEILI